MDELVDKLLDLEDSKKLLNVADTFTARIYLGLWDTEENVIYRKSRVKGFCQSYVERVGLCVNIQETGYRYGAGGEGGMEPGVVVELIHYPRFEQENPKDSITTKALDLAEMLMEQYHQKRVSVVTTDETYTLRNPNHSEVEC